MATEHRQNPVVDFAFKPTDERLADALSRCLGKVVSLGCSVLYLSPALATVGTAGSTAFIDSGRSVYNFADAGVDEVRLVGYGQASSTAVTLSLYNVTTSTSICQASSLSAGAGYFTGTWTQILPRNNDDSFGLRVTLAGGESCSLARVELQYRTVHFQG